MPVRLAVGGTDLLKWGKRPLKSVMVAEVGTPATEQLWTSSPDPWRVLPVLHMLTAVPTALSDAQSSGAGRTFLPGGGGWLEFRQQLERVRISCTDNGQEALALVRDVHAAFRRFEESLRDRLQEDLPELAADPYWEAWIGGESKLPATSWPQSGARQTKL